jgi:hypothetical protein
MPWVWLPAKSLLQRESLPHHGRMRSDWPEGVVRFASTCAGMVCQYSLELMMARCMLTVDTRVLHGTHACATSVPSRVTNAASETL